MTKTSFKTAIAATLTIATLAVATTTSAQAGSKDFWRGAAVGAVAGVVTGAIVNNHRREREVVYVDRYQPRTVVVERPVYGDRHINWCLRKYRSYDVRSDTYVSFSGGRRYCNSPYN